MAKTKINLIFAGARNWKGKDKKTQEVKEYNLVNVLEVDENKQAEPVGIFFDEMPKIAKDLKFGDTIECSIESYSALGKGRVTEIIRKISDSPFQFNTAS